MTSADIRRAVNGRPSTMGTLVAAFIIVILVATPQAQQPPGYAGGMGPAGSTGAFVPANATEIDLLVGRSTVLNVGTPIARVSLTVPDIADAMVTAPTQLLIHGKQPGTISLFVWDRGGAITTYEVTVRRDLTALAEHMRRLFPGENITVTGSGTDVVVSGTVSSKYVIEKAADVAGGYVEKKENVVNLLRQQEGVASNQVMLRVRFAEVSRSAMQELGATFIANGAGANNQWYGRTAPPGVPSPEFDDGRLVFSDFLNLFLFNAREGLGGAVRALQSKGLFQSLAEPNLVATNGREASFLAGGEYPYPVVQSGTGANSVTIMFKEFGVRLSFTPTVLGGDLIHLKVRPEVSSLDFANAVTIDGFRIPALSTRRTETEVELRDGQTFAIAGLMNNTVNSTMSRIPGIGDIPIIGALFRSRAYQKNQTELVVMITPVIIRKGQMGVSEDLPSLVEPYLGPPNRTYPNPDAYVGSPRYPTNQPVPHGGREEPPAPAPAQPVAPANVHPAAQPAPPNAPLAPAGSVPPGPAAPPPPPQPVTGDTAAEPVPERAVEPAPAAPVAAPPPAAVPPHRPPTPAEARAMREALERDRKDREREEKARAAAEKREAKEARAAAKRAEADRKRAEKLERERAKREAEVAEKNAEIARKQAEEELRRDRALAEAAARLKAAQEAYQADIERTQGGSDEKTKVGGEQNRPPSPPRP
jgi:pilus assembly protein CpaC